MLYYTFPYFSQARSYIDLFCRRLDSAF